jgi:HPt (histidine-containing phosphotransfer) domain-containing protein
MLLELTEPEMGALIDLLVQRIERSKPSSNTDLLHSVLAKLGADAAAQPVDPASPLDEAILTALRDLRREDRPDVPTLLVALFQESAPAILKELETAAMSADPAALLRVLHKLRGISAIIGARLLTARCTQLEAAARMGSVPENAGAQVEAISQEYRRAEAALKSWCGAVAQSDGLVPSLGSA